VQLDYQVKVSDDLIIWSEAPDVEIVTESAQRMVVRDI
jgi:hypothetical protein